MTTRAETEIAHMLRMLAPPFFENWKEEIWRKAKHLAATDADYADLPAMLAQAVAARNKSSEPTSSLK